MLNRSPHCPFFTLSLVCLIIPLSLNAQIAQEKCKFLGNVIPATTPEDFKTYWNQVTPENGGKWGSVESKRDEMKWTALDNAYQFAIANDLPFKQHTLVWGQQQPAWISTLTETEKKEEVEEWIRTFCERYPKTTYIDVVNEPLHAVPDYANALGGSGSTGWDWIVWTFEKARQYCPNAKLILNDYNILSNDAATTNYLNIIELLKDKGLIDIVGEQGHFMETTPSATIKKNLDRLAAAGLPIHISEYDVNLANDQQQAEKYKEQFPILWEHPAVKGITLWGYRQGHIWRDDAYLLRSDGSPRPALTWLSKYIADSTPCGGPVTGMLEDHEERMKVYPIPARDGRLTLDLGAGNFDVTIRDLQGRIKKEVSVGGYELVTLTLGPGHGLYLLEVYDGQRTLYKKIQVN